MNLQALRKIAEDKEKKSSGELAGALLGAGLGGLGGSLIKKYIDGDNPTKWTDYLLWGGGGAALGGALGYGIASADPEKYTDAEITKLAEKVKELEERAEALAEEGKKHDFISAFGLPALTVASSVPAGWLTGRFLKRPINDLADRLVIIGKDIDKHKIALETAILNKDQTAEKSARQLIKANEKRAKGLRAKLWPLKMLPWIAGAVPAITGSIWGWNNARKWIDDGAIDFNPARWDFGSTQRELEQARKNLEEAQKSNK